MKKAILYRDEDIVVINKPGGLLSVPGRGTEKQDSVVFRLRKMFPNMIEQPAVHRLDMHTSGLMVCAMTKSAHSILSKQFENRLVLKRYEAVLEGVLLGKEGKITLSFRLDPHNRPKQIHDPVQGKTGTTLWKTMGGEPRDRTRVEFTPLTGRTHQLRLHAAHPKGLGMPIVGDYLYGYGNDGDRMLLHATFLQFIHPRHNKEINFNSSPPF
jgi:tRNA pseudouridine32 synthase/23S rRNA pseudouridine746 synthase